MQHEESVDEHPWSSPEHGAGSWRRTPLAAAILVVALLVGALGAVAATSASRSAEREPLVSSREAATATATATAATALAPAGARPPPSAPQPIAAAAQVPAAIRSAVRPAPPAHPPRTFTLAVSGDILPHVQVVARAAALGRANAAPYDFAPLFAPIRGVVEGADLALCHLEVPLTTDGTPPSGYPAFRSPSEVATGVAATGYDGCSTASNHSVDAGMAGITQTLDALDGMGLRHAGTARSPQEATAPVIYDVEGVRVGHLAATYGLNGLPIPVDAPWSVNLIDIEAILAGAQGLRDAGAEVVVASLHWGVEYQHAPTAEQQAIADQLLASGLVEAIVGHHAHVVQPVARLHDRVVVYGLGNSLSGQSQPGTQDGVVVTLRFAEEDAARHPTPGAFRVSEVVATPTFVTRPDYRVVAVPALLADPALDAATRATLEASDTRTAEALGSEATVR